MGDGWQHKDDVPDHEHWHIDDNMETWKYSGVTTREQAKQRAKAVRREHAARLNAQHTEVQDWAPSGHPAFSNTPTQDVANRKKRKSNMKSKNELANLAATTSTEIITVQCEYSDGGKRYTYLCSKELASELVSGDKVLVSTNGDDFNMVRVKHFDEDCDIDDLSFKYQWLFMKLDTAELERMRSWHKAAGDALHKMQRKRAQQAVIAEMGGVDSIPALALTSGVTEDVIDAEDVGKQSPYSGPSVSCDARPGGSKE